MIEPSLAPVCPRVISADGERRPLEDVIENLVSKGDATSVVVWGPAGSGKTTALRHLAEVFASRPEWQERIRFVDTAGSLTMPSKPEKRPAQFTIAAARAFLVGSNQRLTLAPWGRDELIEYSLAKYPGECAFIMARAGDESVCEGLPLLMTIAVDQLASDGSLPNVSSALYSHLATLDLTADERNTCCRFAWEAMSRHADGEPSIETIVPNHCRQFLLLGPIQCLLACEFYISQLRSPQGQMILMQRLPDDLLPAVADGLRDDRTVFFQLRNVLTRTTDRALHAAAATLLVAIDPTWRPRNVMRDTNLNEATLNGVCWPGLDLSGADLNNASLRDADLSNARLAGATLDSTCLKHANLQGADLTGGVTLAHCDATGAQFQNADLTRAIFEGAELEEANFNGAILQTAGLLNAILCNTSFRNANLTGATLVGSKLMDCDFTGANLESASLDGLDLTTCNFSGACLEGASMYDCVMEDTGFGSINLCHANLHQAFMSGSRLQGADLRWADLSNTKLGDIDWENADLRYADLTGATFHMGSSRSGLVSSPLACEGTRTGFYTDELHEQHFKAAEDIRKANLRGADLRGAVLVAVDFYLVDLRDAKLDPHQLEYAKSCGAILNDWVVD